MKYVSLDLVFFLVLVAQSVALADEPYTSLSQEALKIIKTQFPDATFTKDQMGNQEFKAKIRSFTIYRPDKMGNWQKGHEELAPDRGGISVRFSVRKGAWSGALAVPYSGTSDLYVFKETHVIKNSPDSTYHIWAEVQTPRFDSPDEIRSKLVALFNDFEKYE